MKARSLCLIAAGWAVSAGSALAACQVAGPDATATASCGSFSAVHGLADTDVLLGQAAVTARLGAQRLGALADGPLLGRYPQDDASAAGDTFANQPARTIVEIVPPPVPEPEGVLAALAALATLGTLVARRRSRDAAQRQGGAAAA